LRKKQGTLIGHAPIVEQLRWCRQAAVRRAVFTHCGSQIVRMEANALKAAVDRLGGEAGM
jgi:hypothetical protein